jgi:hypothetical protein
MELLGHVGAVLANIALHPDGRAAVNDAGGLQLLVSFAQASGEGSEVCCFSVTLTPLRCPFSEVVVLSGLAGIANASEDRPWRLTRL